MRIRREGETPVLPGVHSTILPPPAGGSNERPTASAPRRSQRLNPIVGYCPNESNLALRKVGENNSLRIQCKEKSVRDATSIGYLSGGAKFNRPKQRHRRPTQRHRDPADARDARRDGGRRGGR